MRSLTKDTRLCISLAARPSDIGTRFHNALYAELGLNFVYKACTTTDLPAAVAGVRALGIRGCGVSMPFKEAVIPLADELDASARAVDAVNTLVNEDGRLRAYNTDVIAVARLLDEHGVGTAGQYAVLGSGGMAKAVLAALHIAGFAPGTVVARNEGTGRALAQRYGAEWRSGLGTARPRVLVNATPVGMAGGPAEVDLPVEPDVVDAAEVVLDVVASPEPTPLVHRARARGTRVITGAEVIALQAAEQFELYTGVRPTPEQVRRASEHSRATG